MPMFLGSGDANVGCCGVVGTTLAFRSIGHGFDSEHRIFSHQNASADITGEVLTGRYSSAPILTSRCPVINENSAVFKI